MLIKISDPKGEKSFFVRRMFAFSAVKKLNEAGMIKLSFPDDLAGLEEFEIKKGFLIQAFLPDEKKKVHCIFSGYIEERSIVGNVVNLVGYDFIGYAKHRMVREDLKFQNTAIKSIVETIFWKLNAVSVLPFSLGKNDGEELINIEFKAFTSLYTILKELSKKVSDLQIRHRSEIVGNGSKEYLDISKNCGVQHSWIWSDNANIQQRNSKVVSREWKDSLWNTCNYWRDNNGNIRENQSSISQWLLFEKFEQNPEKTPDELVESAGLVTIVPEVSREEMTQLTVGDQKAIRLIARLEWARFEYLGIIQEVSFGSNSAGGLDFSIKIWEKLIEQKNILDKTLANLASAVKKSWPSNTPAPSVDLSWYATSSAVNQAIQSQNTKIEKKADSSFVQWVAQTAQTALNTANEAKQTADSKANDSDVVHKSWDEVIGGNKTFNGTITSQYFNTKQDWKTNWINIWKEWELNRIDSFNDSSWFVDLNIRAKKLNFEWSSIVSNGQDWTGEWQGYTPTVSSQRGSPSLNYSSGRYKQIGKTVHCYARAEVKRNNWWGRFWISLPIPAKDYGEIISGISLVGRIGTKQESTYWYITAGGATAQILSGIWSAAHMGNLPETFQIHINLTYESQ